MKKKAAQKRAMMEARQAESTRNIARWATFMIAGAGFTLSWYLNEMHLQAALGQEVGGALCGAHRVMDCEAAATSAFSELFGLPIALLGLAVYAGLVVLTLFDRKDLRLSEAPLRPATLATLLFAGSVAYSIFLAGVSAFVLSSLCPFCIMLYVVNGMGLVTAAMWAGDKPHRVVLGLLQQPRALASGWTIFFVGNFVFFLILGFQVGEIAERDRRAKSRPDIATLPQQAARDVHRPGAPSMGPEDAPIQIVKFSNFPCPHCALLAEVLHQIKAEYPEEVRVEYRHFPLGHQEHGMTAAQAAHCAHQQGAFWPMHDLLFASSPAHDEEAVRSYARELDLDEAAFSACLASDESRRWVESDQLTGRRLGVEGTPSFFINGYQLSGALPMPLLRELIDEALELQAAGAL